jgi:hypothetical protein
MYNPQGFKTGNTPQDCTRIYLPTYLNTSSLVTSPKKPEKALRPCLATPKL